MKKIINTKCGICGKELKVFEWSGWEKRLIICPNHTTEEQMEYQKKHNHLRNV